MKQQAGEGVEAGGGLNASFNLQPVEEALNGLSVMADISVIVNDTNNLTCD